MAHLNLDSHFNIRLVGYVPTDHPMTSQESFRVWHVNPEYLDLETSPKIPLLTFVSTNYTT